jgi:hypothetical protein
MVDPMSLRFLGEEAEGLCRSERQMIWDAADGIEELEARLEAVRVEALEEAAGVAETCILTSKLAPGHACGMAAAAEQISDAIRALARPRQDEEPKA